MFQTSLDAALDDASDCQSAPLKWKYVSSTAGGTWFLATEHCAALELFEELTERELIFDSLPVLGEKLAQRAGQGAIQKIHVLASSEVFSQMEGDRRIGVVKRLTRFDTEGKDTHKYLAETTLGIFLHDSADGCWSTAERQVLFDIKGRLSDRELSESTIAFADRDLHQKVLLKVLDIFPDDFQGAIQWWRKKQVQLDGKSPSEVANEEEYEMFNALISEFEHT